MKTFAQILYGRAHWIFTAPERPEFAPNIMLVDITDLDPRPQEGWLYDVTTGVFSEPPEPEPVEPTPDPLDDIRNELLTTQEAAAFLYEQSLQLQEENLMALEGIATLYEMLLGGVPQ